MEAIARYLEAIQRINDADRELDQMLETVNQAVRTLPDRWATLTVLGIDEPLVPNVPSTCERNTISSAQWPTIDQIARILTQMHAAYEAAEMAWQKVEPKLRDFLYSPPKRFPMANRLNVIAPVAGTNRCAQPAKGAQTATFDA